MGRIVVVEYLTLDGVFDDPAWSGPYFDAEVRLFIRGAPSTFTVLDNRTTASGMTLLTLEAA